MALKNINNIINKKFVILFLVAIWMPFIGSILRIEVSSEESILSTELRPAASFPELKFVKGYDVNDFLRSVEAYYNDRFGFRKILIRWHGIIKVLWLGTSSSTQVTVGKEGWFFLRIDGSINEIDYYRSIYPFTPDQLAQWQRILEQRNNWLAAQGIHYLIVIAPNKTTIYPEYLPDSINRVREDSRLDQLINYLRVNSNVTILDLRTPLRSSKVNNRVYHRTDSHWNDLGAFIAYQEIIKQLAVWFPETKVSFRSNFKTKTTYGNGDLINMLGLKNIIQEEVFKLIPYNQPLAHRVEAGISRPNLSKDMQPFATELQNSNLPKAVMFHDSFTTKGLSPFLSEHFGRILYLWQDDFDAQVIQKEHPNVVIQQMVERKLMSHIPK